MADKKKTVTVRQIKSANRKPDIQMATLKGLGLGKIRRTRTLEDTPAIRGMIQANATRSVTSVPPFRCIGEATSCAVIGPGGLWAGRKKLKTLGASIGSCK